MEDTSKKLSFEEMESYVDKLNSHFYNAMVGEVVSVAIAEETELSIDEINNIASRLCESDELTNTINEIILENL